MNNATEPRTVRAVFPSLKYDNAPRAIEFLCDAFGFEKYAVFPGGNGDGSFVQLKLGGNFVMVSSTSTDSGAISTPAALAGAIGGIFVVLESDADVELHFERARAGGALVSGDPVSGIRGGRSFTASDSEGYVWTFSSYHLV